MAAEPKLSKRLTAIAGMVNAAGSGSESRVPGYCLCDVGTDHAHIPIRLIRDGMIARSIYPTVKAASGVDHEKASVKGSVIGDLPEGATVKVNYGTSTSLGTQSSALTADTKGVYTADLTSLSAETKYYYRLEVTIGTDKYVSETKDFTTTAAPAGGGGAA